MQTRFFPRHLPDFKARLLLGKTQFGKTLAKWSPLHVSQGCKVCLRQGHFEYDDLNHRLLECPTAKIIINHIQTTLTKQNIVSPVHIILTNFRCIYQIKMLNKNNNDPTEVHKHCATFNKDKLHTNLGNTFIWDNYIRYMMQCSNTDEIPNKSEAIKYVLDEIQNFMRSVPGNPLCIELVKVIRNKNT